MRIALFLSLLATSCASSPDYLPPVALETPNGTVYAQSQNTAEATARVLEAAPTIRDQLESTRGALPVIWVLASARAHLNGAVGACGPDRIQIGFDALLHLRTVVVHELVHWYAVDSPYEDVPLFIEEGLATYIAAGMPKSSDRTLPIYMLSDPDTFPMAELSLTIEEAHTLPIVRYAQLCEAAAGVVTRLGLERVRELADRNAELPEYVAESKRGDDFELLDGLRITRDPNP